MTMTVTKYQSISTDSKQIIRWLVTFFLVMNLELYMMMQWYADFAMPSIHVNTLLFGMCFFPNTNLHGTWLLTTLEALGMMLFIAVITAYLVQRYYRYCKTLTIASACDHAEDIWLGVGKCFARYFTIWHDITTSRLPPFSGKWRWPLWILLHCGFGQFLVLKLGSNYR